MKLGPIYISPVKYWFDSAHHEFWGTFYIFRNRPDIVPGRWGFGIMGIFEFGSRNPGNKFGIFLKNIGLWPY